MTALLAFLMIGALWGGLDQTAEPSVVVEPSLPAAMHAVLDPLDLISSWAMFKYFSLLRDGWIVVQGQSADGRQSDLYRSADPLSERPQILWGPAMRLRQFDLVIASYRFTSILRAWGSYYCQLDQRAIQRRGGMRLVRVEIHYQYRRSYPPGGARRPLQDDLLWQHWCAP